MTHFKPRADAVWHNGRRMVPHIWGQIEGNTQHVTNLAEFKAAGGVMHFNEDQTEVYLTLPEGWRFSIQFPGDDEQKKTKEL